MEFRRICDDISSMSMTELAHNHVFVRGGEAWYRDYDREISVRDLMKEIYSKYESSADVNEMNKDELDEMLFDNLQFGTDELDGVFSILYLTMWGMAEVREWLKAYEEYGLPTTMRPEILREAVETYGKEAQVDMAIEEMSELTKALLKHRRAEHSPEAWDYEKTRRNILEEIADVIIMLMQLLMIYGGREVVQRDINDKVKRLETLLTAAAKEAGTDAAQDVLRSAT